MSKYGAVKVEEDGYTFDSKAEHRHYRDLKLRLAAGEITHLGVHPAWELVVNGHKIGKYTSDFEFQERTADGQWRYVVEDVKGVRTRDYVLRRKLMLALHGIEIREVRR